jgi:hypothetical protein
MIKPFSIRRKRNGVNDINNPEIAAETVIN